MLNKSMSEAVMRLTVICILLFNISYGLRLPFGLDNIFHALSDGNIPFLNLGSSRESKPIHLDEKSKSRISKTYIPSYDSITFNRSISDDSLKSFDGTETEMSSEDSLENTTAKTGETTSSRILKHFSDLAAENISSTLTTSAMEDSMETVAGKVNKTSSDVDLEGSAAGGSGKTLKDNFSPTSAPDKNATDAIKGAIQNTGLGRNCSVIGNPMETIMSELKNGDKCIYMSAAKTFPQVSSVATFVNTFMNAVNSSQLLTTLFNIMNARPEQYSQFKYRFIADVFRTRFVDANEIAAAAVRPIAKYFAVLPLPAMMRVYSNFFADFFFAEAILTPHNAKALAQKYIKSMEEIAKRYKINYFDSDYNRKFQAIGDGTRNFFFSLIEPSLSETWELALYYAHEWLLAALDYGDLKDLTFKKEDICENN